MIVFQIIFCLFLFTLADCIGFFSTQQVLKYTDYSSKLSKNPINGYMLAFADFNADRNLDIFILQEDKSAYYVKLIQMPRKDTTYSKSLDLIKNNEKDIRNIIVGDFNGDSIIDVVTCNSAKPEGPYSISIVFGNTNRDGVSKIKPISGEPFKYQPIHLDYNADMISDLFGVNEKKEFQVCLGTKSPGTSITCKNIKDEHGILSSVGELRFIQFVDVNGDSNSDILFIGLNSGKVTLASLIKSGKKFIKGPSSTLQADISKLGQPIVKDFDFTGKLSLIAPVCKDVNCGDSQLMGCKFSSDIECKLIKLTKNGYNFQTKLPPRLSLITTEISQLNCGDTRLTGYIDCFVPMITDKSKASQLVRLKNMGGLNEGFEITKLEVTNEKLRTNISQVAVFDLEEDGIPDLFTTTIDHVIRPLKQDTPAESYFIKVMVLDGFCNSLDNCPDNKLPYGIPLPGVALSYSTEGAISGKTQKSIASICPDSSYSSLQLPYTLFGLGSFANYVEKLTVTIPFNNKRKSHSMSFIVPKTQIVIIPYPLDHPEKWKNKLFLEPFLNRKVIYVAAALLGTMLVVAIILCILQYLEVREDRQEKMAEAQKFHFDAM